MKDSYKYILIAAGLLLLGFFLWYFSSIVAYFIVASILAMIGLPLIEFLGKLHIGKFRIPVSLRALIVLILMWVLFIGFFRIFIPIVVKEASVLSTIDVDSVLIKLDEPITDLEATYNKYMPVSDRINIREVIKGKIQSILNISILSSLFGSLAGILGNLFIAIFSITFITFFLLKNPYMLTEAIVLFVHQKHETAIRRALKSIRHLLTRYFIGVAGQLTEILILVTIGMTIVGLSFKQSLLIGLTAAILNIVPYLGPLIGSALGIMMGLAFHADMPVDNLVPLMVYMACVFIVVHLIDNFLYQPIAFSSSVHAHPLEIFLVILMAGSLAGVTGMILAIPAYTIIRVFAKEFLNKLRLVKKLTYKIED